MTEISQARLTEVEQLKAAIGWGWNEISNRIGWGPPGLTKFRGLRAPIEDRWLDYLRAVAEAVQGIPLPAEEAAPNFDADNALIGAGGMHYEGDSEVDAKLRAAGLRPADTDTKEVRVMLLDDIAAKLAEEYRSIAADAGSSEELRTARATISRVAERLGVVDQLRALLRPNAAEPRHPTPERPIHQPAGTWSLPVPQQLPFNPYQREPFNPFEGS